MIVRSASAKGKLLLMHAAATWQAYNLWGGYSLYQGPNGSYDARSLAVSFDRPYDDVGAEKFLVYEWAAVVQAERLGLPVAYTTGSDVHDDPGVLSAPPRSSRSATTNTGLRSSVRASPRHATRVPMSPSSARTRASAGSASSPANSARIGT
jgi:hypothetical protein